MAAFSATTSLQGVDLRATTPPFNRTLLHTAVFARDAALCAALLSAGADPLQKDVQNVSAVGYARLLAQRWPSNERMLRILALLTDAVDAMETAPAADATTTTTTAETEAEVEARERLPVGEAPPLELGRQWTAPVARSAPMPMGDQEVGEAGEGEQQEGEVTADDVQHVPAIVLALSLRRAQSAHTPAAAPVPGSGGEELLGPALDEGAGGVVQTPQKAMLEGTQVLTSLCLMRVSSGSFWTEEKRGEGPPAIEEELDDENDEDAAFAALQAIFSDEEDGQDGAATVAASTMGAGAGESKEGAPPAAASTSGAGADADESSSFYCAICCDDHNKAALADLCTNPECEGAFCNGCMFEYCKNTVEAGRYSLPPIRCPACLQRIPTVRWRRLKGDESEDLFSTFEKNAMALLNIRCSCCDQTSTLLYDSADVREHRKQLQQHMNSVFGDVSKTHTKRILKAWRRYAKALITADEFLDELVWTLFERLPADQLSSTTDDMAQGEPWDDLNRRFQTMARLCLDLERRATLQVAYLRRFPKLRTRCCDHAMCGLCKVDGWHNGKTCKERQQEDLDTDVQFCPGCGVPTVLVEACSHIVCVCGHEWYWKSGEGEDDEDEY